MTRVLERRFIVYIGGQASGKTWQLKKKIDHYSKVSSIDSIFVFDRLNEYDDIEGHTFLTVSDFLAESSESLPRVCVFQFGPNPDNYEAILMNVTLQGNIMVVIDEAYEFAPAGSVWRGSERLQEIILAGRHLRNSEGKMCPTHLMIAMQYPKSVNHLVTSQANQIYCGTIKGENTEKWMKGLYGKSAWERVQKLKEYEFVLLR